MRTSAALEDIFTGEQSSVATSPDGEKLYELHEGTVNVLNTAGADGMWYGYELKGLE